MDKMIIKTTDNSQKLLSSTIEEFDSLEENVQRSVIEDLEKISQECNSNNNNVLIFSNNKDQIKGKVDIYKLSDVLNSSKTKIETFNVMGFIGSNNTNVSISSRFANKGEDYFLHYMLKKVFNINIFDLKHNTSKDDVFDLLIYLFRYYFENALSQGLYKEYHKHEYNDSNVKGSIDINRHIRSNIPFNGKIAYRVREHKFDNKITQLIRHTIEFIKQHKFGAGILSSDINIKENVDLIEQNTPSYQRNQRQIVISKNIKTFSHPFFYKYRDLQKICLQILRYEKIKYGGKDSEIYGLLFDGAWLWEKYLWTFLKDMGFDHPEKNERIFKNGIDKSSYRPDFYNKEVVLDAKYKRLDTLSRDDRFQIISYMYLTESKKGSFINPIEEKEGNITYRDLGELNGYGGNVSIFSLPIPQSVNSFQEFEDKMLENEKQLKERLEEILNN